MTDCIPETVARNAARCSNESAKQITCSCIEKALIQLLETTEFEKITISELVKCAGVSRTAFYRHYASKEEVLDKLMGSVFDEISETMKRNDFYNVPEVFWRQLLSIAQKHLHPFQLLLKAGLGECILNQITKFAVKVSSPKTTSDYYNEIFWSGAVYNVLLHWIQNNADPSIDEMVSVCCRVKNGI